MYSNYAIGERFQLEGAMALGRILGVPFTARPLPVGTPPYPHEFDLVSHDLRYVGEAKAYAWTSGGNVPSAKIGQLREALQLLHLLPESMRTFIVMKRHCRFGTGEPLADYFVRRNSHLLRATVICELCQDTGHMRSVFGRL